jgi:hypothetical protein
MLADDVRLIQSTYPLRADAADVGMLSFPNVWPAPRLQVDFCELVSGSLL